MLRFLMILSFLTSFASADTESDFQMRVSWVKTMKELMLEIEKKEGHLLVHKERTFIEKWKLIEEAYADSRFDCFYGGWPSKKSGKFCQNPSRTNPSYEKSACKSNELQCQPLLFGKGHCVPGSTQEQRNSSFSNCEKKSEGSYDHLRNISPEEAADLREMSRLAFDVCKDQKTTICEKIRSKIHDGLRSLDRAMISSEAPARRNAPSSKPTLPPAPAPAVTTQHDESNCDDPLHEHREFAQSVTKAASKSMDDIYEAMKAEFQSSPMCDPLKIVNDPSDKPSALLLNKLTHELKEIEYVGNRQGPKDDFLRSLSERWSISTDVEREILPMLNQLKPYGQAEEERKNLSARIKGLILQDFIKKKNAGPIHEVKEDLVKRHIFKKNDYGEIECPFVSKDAFMKAMQGRENLLKQHNVKNKNQITIVDYTRPSNERRLFVIDLDSNKVLHNTWVAHGGGSKGSELKGKDGLGGSPEMSNTPGSLKSSDGFVIATQAASGSLYGPNVLLNGVDQNNTKIAARAIVLHGWGSPMDSYTKGLELYNFRTDKYDPPRDVISDIQKMDFRSASFDAMDTAITNLRISTGTSEYLNTTEGCLGVPTINVKHLDRKGRNKSQLELLREDLPGSVIFNYSGPEMSSRYF